MQDVFLVYNSENVVVAEWVLLFLVEGVVPSVFFCRCWVGGWGEEHSRGTRT